MKKTKHIISGIFLVFIFTFSVLLAVLPKQDYSQNEKRVLTLFPEFSTEALFDGSWFKDIETFVSDQFPFRDAFVGINAYYNLLTGRNGSNGVYKCDDGYLIADAEEIDFTRTERNIQIMSEFAKNNNLPAKLIIVPTPGYIMENVLPKNHTQYHDDEIFSVAEEKLDGIELIDMREVFKQKREDTQLYFRTDHHLTTAGSYVMYEQFCKAKGITPVSDFKETETLKDFYGTNYSKSGLWLEKPDVVEIRHSSNDYEYEVTIDDMTEKNTYDSLYFYEHDKNMDKYPVFLNGNHALVSVKNKSVTNGEKLLIVKDSYSHCFATFLCENYEEIHLVDLRYFRQSTSELIEANGITEILYLYGAENFANMSDISWLR